MSQVLSYNNKTTKTSAQDWIPVAPYVEDDIKQIKDPNGGMSENPRTAIPSPFAQLDQRFQAPLHSLTWLRTHLSTLQATRAWQAR